jgi:iron complex transport system substrate-binding protein
LVSLALAGNRAEESIPMWRRGAEQIERRGLALVVAAVIALAVGGCGDTNGSAGQQPAPAGDSEPVSVTDCGGETSTYESPPERIVTMEYTSLEMLFWLGVQDRVVGTGSPPPPGVLPRQFEAAGQEIRKLGAKYEANNSSDSGTVTREILLGSDPDLVFASFPFSTDGGGATQEQLTQSGIDSYVAFSTNCDALSEPQTDLGTVYRDIENLGAMLGVEERAQELVATMRAEVADVQGRVEGSERPTVLPFEYSEGTGSVLAPANRSTINAVIEQAGGRNIFADIDKSNEGVGWEEVAKRNPDAILIINYSAATPEENEAANEAAREFLNGFGAIENVTAVREKRYPTLLYEQGSQGSVRNAEAVTQLARQLHPDRFEGGR